MRFRSRRLDRCRGADDSGKAANGCRWQQRSVPYRSPRQRYDHWLRQWQRDTVYFDSQAYGSGSGISITTCGSVTTVEFDRHWTGFSIQGVSMLKFSDGHVIHI